MSDALLMGRPMAFEKGDHIYLTTPLTLATPTAGEIEEFAFASAVKSNAPNEHIGWLSGRYVEAGKANLNNTMWLNDELALKSLTPMLMPVTVMHDPRTAVGTIADCQLVSEGSNRIDTILAIWKHRFSDIWEEAALNINDGTMMQSMECMSPSYCCSECNQQYVKLPEGKERASWCEHLRHNSSCRILGDVCFTGTGLIFGSRGGKGAYTEAYLDEFQDEIAEYHAKAHIDSAYRSRGAKDTMPNVEIAQSELDALRKERDDERAAAAKAADDVRELTTKVETAEADTVKEKARADAAEAKATELETAAQKTELKDKRIEALGDAFLSAMGDFTRQRFTEAASTLSDEDWEAELKEKEELLDTERGAESGGEGTPSKTESGPKKLKKGTSKGGEPGSGNGGATGTAAATEDEGATFKDEELAAFVATGVAAGQSPERPSGASRALARTLSRARRPAPSTTGTDK